MTDAWPEVTCYGIGVTQGGQGPVEPGDEAFHHWECAEHPQWNLTIVPRRGHWVGVCPVTKKEAVRLAVIAPTDR